MSVIIILTMASSKKKNQANKYFLIDCHSERLKVGGAGLALTFPRTGLVIGLPDHQVMHLFLNRILAFAVSKP